MSSAVVRTKPNSFVPLSFGDGDGDELDEESMMAAYDECINADGGKMACRERGVAAYGDCISERRYTAGQRASLSADIGRSRTLSCG